MLKTLPAPKFQAEILRYASAQPFCPKAEHFAKLYPELMQDCDDVYGELYREMGKALHSVVQRRIGDAYNCFGYWQCPTCGKHWNKSWKPEHEHPVSYQTPKESKYPVPGVGCNCKPDIIVATQYNPFKLALIEIKGCVSQLDRPKRSHYLQANLTAYSFAVSTGYDLQDFALLYIPRGNCYQDQTFWFKRDDELAKLLIHLMSPGVTQIGICKNPGSWDCPFSSICFKDGEQGKWWVDNPEISSKLEQLYWPETL